MARRALYRAAFWRCAVVAISFPGDLLNALASMIRQLALLFDGMSDAAFYFEADAARQYRTLTGVDLGFATRGSLERYAGTNPAALARAESDEFEDEDDDDA